MVNAKLPFSRGSQSRSPRWQEHPKSRARLELVALPEIGLLFPFLGFGETISWGAR
jgi:hypothetical protein